MPQHKSAIKRVRQSEKHRIRNRVRRSKMRTLVKKVLTEKDKDKAEIAYKEAAGYLDRMTVKGIIHENNAAHKKSRLAKYVNQL